MISAQQDYINAQSDSTGSGVSWGAIFAGAAVTAALYLTLLILGIGLGFSTVSPWQSEGLSMTALGVSAIIWLIATQVIASGVGGYLAGRLRSRWITLHIDEVYFRDTAHGFLAWAVASLIAATLVGTVIGNLVQGGASAGATVLSSVASDVSGFSSKASSGANTTSTDKQQPGTDSSGAARSSDDTLNYMIDSLFRSSQPSVGDANQGGIDDATRAEIQPIIINGLRSNGLPQADQQYLAQLVASKTGLSPADAQKRVNDVFTDVQTTLVAIEQHAKQAADKARKAAAYSSLWVFVALLSGAFVASLFATYGGKRRDRVVQKNGVL